MAERKSPNQLLASKGGVARANSLTSEERSQIASHAAAERWKLPRATHEGKLKVGDIEFACSVLEDQTRVITESDFMAGMGMYRSGALSTRRKDVSARNQGGAQTPLFLAQKNLKPFIDRHLGSEHIEPLRYLPLSGNIAHGIRADLIPKICEVWIDAHREGAGLGPRQVRIAERADILLRGLAHVGIIALVDEATGFQSERSRDALAQILEKFIAKELRPWVKTFPPEFYENMFKLRGWPYLAGSVKRPGAVGYYTTDVVYQRLAPGVLDELKRLTPRDDKGRLKQKLHQRLSDTVGHPKLREHLSAVVALMKISDDWNGFMANLDRALPRYGDTLLIPFTAEDRQ